MKKIIAGMVLAGVLFAGNAFAQEIDICDFTATIAERMMQSRQNNADLMSVSKAMKELELPESLDNLVQLIIRAAWAQPRYSVERNQKNAVMDFKNTLYLECLKTTAK